MHTDRLQRLFICPAAAAACCAIALAAPTAGRAAHASSSNCTGDSGLTLPAGFCATVFADGIGHARDLVVGENGVVYVNTWSGRYYGNDTPHAGGFLVALQDSGGSGKANVNERFGATVQGGGAGGTGIGIYKGWLYAELNDKILKYPFKKGSIVPGEASQVVVSGLPLGGDHPMHPFAIDAGGDLYVDVASATNSCQEKNRTLKSPGRNPCTELETRGGVWRYDAKNMNRCFLPAGRYATGIRNAEGFGIDAIGHHIFVTQHGRISLRTNWPDVIRIPELEATLPSEEVLLLTKGGDYGRPCAITIRISRRWCSRPSMAVMEKPRVRARRKPGRSPTSRRIGRPTAWCFTTRNNSPLTTSRACSSHSTVRGIAHRMRKAATTSCTKGCRATRPRASARYSQTVLQERTNHPAKHRTVRAAWPWDPMAHCMSSTMWPAASIVSSIEAVPILALHRRCPVPAPPTRPDRSPRHRRSPPRARILMQVRPPQD